MQHSRESISRILGYLNLNCIKNASQSSGSIWRNIRPSVSLLPTAIAAEGVPLGAASDDDADVVYTRFEARRAARQGTPFPIDLRSEDWVVRVQGEWTRGEHINKLELEALLLYLCSRLLYCILYHSGRLLLCELLHLSDF